MSDDQFINCKLSKKGKPGKGGISRPTCYSNILSLCKELKIDPITEKMCKALGTRYNSISFKYIFIIRSLF